MGQRQRPHRFPGSPSRPRSSDVCFPCYRRAGSAGEEGASWRSVPLSPAVAPWATVSGTHVLRRQIRNHFSNMEIKCECVCAACMCVHTHMRVCSVHMYVACMCVCSACMCVCWLNSWPRPPLLRPCSKSPPSVHTSFGRISPNYSQRHV